MARQRDPDHPATPLRTGQQNRNVRFKDKKKVSIRSVVKYTSWGVAAAWLAFFLFDLVCHFVKTDEKTNKVATWGGVLPDDFAWRITASITASMIFTLLGLVASIWKRNNATTFNVVVSGEGARVENITIQHMPPPSASRPSAQRQSRVSTRSARRNLTGDMEAENRSYQSSPESPLSASNYQTPVAANQADEAEQYKELIRFYLCIMLYAIGFNLDEESQTASLSKELGQSRRIALRSKINAPEKIPAITTDIAWKSCVRYYLEGNAISLPEGQHSNLIILKGYADAFANLVARVCQSREKSKGRERQALRDFVDSELDFRSKNGAGFFPVHPSVQDDMLQLQADLNSTDPSEMNKKWVTISATA